MCNTCDSGAGKILKCEQQINYNFGMLDNNTPALMVALNDKAGQKDDWIKHGAINT